MFQHNDSRNQANNAQFIVCTLNSWNFEDATLVGANFSSCTIKKCNFKNLILIWGQRLVDFSD